ncbi:nitrite reductase small subunit NirD [Enterobacter cloacae subsp. cloacae]|nr:nitrite reductase small subunit NirD [Enterobacter cloacae subsp. cloacae]
MLGNEQVAIFALATTNRFLPSAISTRFFEASVLSRGLITEHQGELWVASPLKKQRFRLSDGLCMEDESYSVKHYDVRVKDGQCS